MIAAAWPLLLTLAVLPNGTASARDATDPYEPYRSPDDSSRDFDFDSSVIKPWKELKANIPVISEEGLESVEIDHGPPGLKYKIDMDTLTVGGDDVVRYWLVTETGGRRSNVLFEGLHCAQGMYKTYAYASPRRLSLIKPVNSAEWQAVGPRDGQDYHHELMHHYFCWKGSPRTLIGMRNALRDSYNAQTPQAEDADFIRP